MADQNKKANLLLFVHGLTGSKKTWERKKKKTIYDYVRQDSDIVKNFDFEIFEYHTELGEKWRNIKYWIFRSFGKELAYKKNLPIERIARLMRSEIMTRYNVYEKIVFITHSMGGLVTKSYLLTEISNDQSVLHNTFISLAVPHRGASIATLGSVFFRNTHLRQLGLHSEFSSDLNDNWLGNLGNIPKTWCFVAEYDPIVKEPHWQVISTTDQNNFSCKKDHTNILIPDGPKDTVFLKIKEICLSVISNQKSILPKKQEETFSNISQPIVIDDPGKLQDCLNKLTYLYDITYQINEGCKISDDALKLFHPQVDLVRWWALFHNRKMEWPLVRKTLSEIDRKTTDDIIKAECRFGIFESYLNEFIRTRHQKLLEFEKLKEAKGKFLDQVPNKESIGKYYYFSARYYEAEWCVIPSYSGKIASLNILNSAIKLLDIALDLYPKNSGSGYSKTYPIPWWLHCHKAMLYKIMKHEHFEECCDNFMDIMKKELEKKENMLKKSIHIYTATYYMMKDDEDGLRQFLNDLVLGVTNRIKELGLSHYEDSEVESYVYHYIDILFWREENEKTKTTYFEIMNKFQLDCPW